MTAWQLSVEQWHVLLRRLGCRPHTPLRFPTHGPRTRGELAAHDERVRAQRPELFDDPELMTAIRAVTSPSSWLEGIFARNPELSAQQEPERMLGVHGATHGVLACQNQLEVRLRVVPNRSLTRAFIAALPPAHPGGHPEITLPFPESSTDSIPAPRNRSPVAAPDPNTAALHELLHTRPCFHIGEATANLRDRNGTEHRSQTFRWWDTDDGRYLAHAVRRGGRPWLAATPVDNQHFEHYVVRAARALAAATSEQRLS